MHQLEQKLKGILSSWERLLLLIELSNIYRNSQPLKAYHAAFEALHLARDLNDTYWIACSHYAIGNAFLKRERYAEVLFNLERAAELFGKAGHNLRRVESEYLSAVEYEHARHRKKALEIANACLVFFEEEGKTAWLIQTLGLIGKIYSKIGLPDEALHHIHEGITVAKQQNQTCYLGSLYFILAETYYEIGDAQLWKAYLEKSLALEENKNDRFQYALTLSHLACVHLARKNYAVAKQQVEEARDILAELDYPGYLATATGTLSSIYVGIGDEQKGLEYEQKAMDMIRDTENDYLLTFVYMHSGYRHVREGDYRAALPHLLRGLKHVSKFDQAIYAYQLCQQISSCYENIGETEKAFEYYKLYVAKQEEHQGALIHLKVKRAEVQRVRENLHRKIHRKERKISYLAEQNQKNKEKLLALALKLIQQEEQLAKHGEKRITPPPAQLTETWDQFAQQFNTIHHDFYAKLVRSYSELTTTELKVCSLIKVGLSSKEIATLLCVSRRTVDSHRERIRKKFELPPRTSLSNFIASL